ncbi:MAG: 50S ribosomal protein L3 [Candidatus Moranbacteria bacterium]|nr:50S ribosomal protein L3 [Candidatus Moranbacteria bacterium]
MFLIARKLKMTQVWDKDNKLQPVTLVKYLPNKVKALKSQAKHGYEALVLSDGIITKEFRVKDSQSLGYQIADQIKLDSFIQQNRVKVTGISKGKGFQGVVKRHGFKGGIATHGHRHDLRQTGSIGSAFPEHVRKGKKMAGRMGAEQITVKNLSIIQIDEKAGLIKIKGAIPGTRNSAVFIRQT